MCHVGLLQVDSALLVDRQQSRRMDEGVKEREIYTKQQFFQGREREGGNSLQDMWTFYLATKVCEDIWL